MKSTQRLMKGLAGVGFILLMTTAAAHACVVEQKPEPCGLQQDLHWAMTGGIGSPPDPRWETRLDWDFASWRNGGSENHAPLAHAITLWRPMTGITLAQKINWWNKFFDCQTGGVACGPEVGELRFLKGAELLSPGYDPPVMTAAAAVHFWAKKNNNPPLADKARRYLRTSFAMYALAAGTGPARTMIDDSPDTTEDCQINAGGDYYFTGPFIAAAGMRANVSYVCTDDRGVLLGRARHMPFTNNREASTHARVVNYLQAQWAKMTDTNLYENVYALDPASRALILDHIQQGNHAATLMSVLAGVRTSSVYRFLAWNEGGAQVRMTVMEKNLNGNTAPVYAVIYTGGSDRKAHILVPDTDFRNGIAHGTASLLPDVFAPRTVEATNFVRTVQMPVPPLVPLYHIVLGPALDAYQQ